MLFKMPSLRAGKEVHKRVEVCEEEELGGLGLLEVL